MLFAKISTQVLLLYVIIFLSGFAGLGYEMVWTRMLGVGLGHEIAAVLAVVAAFFCGMALGSWSLDGFVSRSKQPGQWYAFLELVIGFWSLILILLIPWANRYAATLTGTDPSVLRHWAIAFILPFILLLPSTFAMGTTLPAMERLFSRLRRDGWSVGGLYAANTFGAVAGTMLSTFLIAPQIGFTATAVLLAAVNFICAAGILIGPARGEFVRPSVQTQHAASSNRILGTLFVTGLLGIGYEVVAIRAVSQILENTIFSFAALLAVYLLGTAAGAAMYQKLAPRHKFEWILTRLLEGTAFFCTIGILILSYSEKIFLWLRSALGGNFLGSVYGEIGLAASVFFLPTLLMGATFSHLAQGARSTTKGLGRALCMNTLGASLAPLVFGVLILPQIGAKLSLIAVSIGYIALIFPRQRSHWIPATATLLIAGMLWYQSDTFNFDKPTSNVRVAAHYDGVMAAVTVLEDNQENYYLKVNNKFLMGGTASRFSDGRQGHIPLLLHPHPRRALFLGIGTGATFAVSADHPDLMADGVELIPEVIAALPYFESATGPLNKYTQLKIHCADARCFVNGIREPYDVIVADLFHPARDGAGFLYTVEHFSAIRSRLTSGGIFCQWLPLYQMDLSVLRTIIRTFLRVFPEGVAYLATNSLQMPIVGLIATDGPLLFEPDYLNSRISSQTMRRTLAAYQLGDFYSLFGLFIAGPKDLADFAGTGPLNTDDRPIVIFRAPQFTYTQNEPAHVRLLELLDHLHAAPNQILKISSESSEKLAGKRLAAYWRARNKFLHVGVGIEQTADVEEMLAKTQQPLLAILRESPDFEPAYRPLVTMARRMQSIDPEVAQKLFLKLEAVKSQNKGAQIVTEQ